MIRVIRKWLYTIEWYYYIGNVTLLRKIKARYRQQKEESVLKSVD